MIVKEPQQDGKTRYYLECTTIFLSGNYRADGYGPVVQGAMGERTLDLYVRAIDDTGTENSVCEVLHEVLMGEVEPLPTAADYLVVSVKMGDPRGDVLVTAREDGPGGTGTTERPDRITRPLDGDGGTGTTERPVRITRPFGEDA